METRTIQLRLQCRGKAPQRFGKNAYIFPMGDSEILQRNGWMPCGGGQKGNYFSPPAGQSGEEALVVAVVPTDAEIERMALAWHMKGKPVYEEIEGWIVVYVTTPKPGSLGPQGIPTWFEFGYNASWGVRISWNEGDEQTPHLKRRDECELKEAVETEAQVSDGYADSGK